MAYTSFKQQSTGLHDSRWLCHLLRILGLWVLLVFTSNLHAQSPFQNKRISTVPSGTPVIRFDSVSIMPSSLIVRNPISGAPIPQAYYAYNANTLLLDTASLRRLCPSCAVLDVEYRVLPFQLERARFRLDSSAMRRRADKNAIEYDFTPYKPQATPWQTGSVRSNGAYVRGLSLGNNQNLVFNSNLNLQLNGNLGDDLNIQAVLSDNSIPLQPDGTTRQLQEFDRIYIQLSKKQSKLIAGDFDLTNPAGYFSRYFKRLQGVNASWSEKISAKDTFFVQGTAAISRGKFARQIVAGQEANQGPYRLVGAAGEQFIIVLAGTEKVFIDGLLMRRGYDDDYIIDYNLGEVTFMPRRLITKDIRIIIEFEYTVQAYLRSTMSAQTAWSSPRWKTALNLYAEQDSRNAGPAQDLSASARRRLSEVGDQVENAFASGVDTLSNGFDPARVLYKSIDTIICGRTTNILVYSTNPDSALYTARFSQVPQGTGHYIAAPSAANGRVYKWVPPDPVTCRPSGNFEPIIQLVAPETRQLFTLNTEFYASKKSKIKTELALSNRDMNRFSPIDNGNNTGVAVASQYRNMLLRPEQHRGWEAQADIHYEFTNKNFAPLNPYRPAEFARDWNTDNLNPNSGNEHWARTMFSLQKKALAIAQYEASGFVQDEQYVGLRHWAKFQLKPKKWDFKLEANLLQSKSPQEATRFSRPKLEVSRAFYSRNRPNAKPIRLGIYGERESNNRINVLTDTLLGISFRYDMWRLFFESGSPESRKQWNGFYGQRIDFAPNQSEMAVSTKAEEVKLGGTWRSLESAYSRHNIQWNIHYRTLQIIAPELTKQQPQETYLGRIDYTLSTLKNALSTTTGYELSTGQTPKIEFNYLRVNPGEGQYTWIDRNRDSILQIDEMELAVFKDQANFLRVAVTTNQYQKTNNIVFNQNLRFEPRLLWPAPSNPWKRTLTRLSLQSTIQLNRRSLADASDANAWNPLYNDLPDSALVSVGSTLRNVLFVNRANPRWDASLSNDAARNQVFLPTGFENRYTSGWTLQTKWNANTKWSVENALNRKWKVSDNQVFVARNFQIMTWQLAPKLSWLPNRYIRTAVQLRLMNSNNQLGAGETALQEHIQVEFNWNPQPKSGSAAAGATALRTQMTWAGVRFDGDPNAPVGFAMLDGLQNGRNVLWGITLDRQLSRSIQINASYEGRQTGTARTIHVGRAQVRAIF